VATWVVGDVQGCFDTLSALLGRIDWRRGRDRLWFVGDLVNRGPKSLQVLRFAAEHDDCVTAVLGNHDLHLLALADGVRRSKSGDTLQAVLAAPDRDDLLGWLRRRPLLHDDGEHLMVHAGLLPSWTVDDAAGHARRLRKALKKQGPEAVREDSALAALTRIRLVDERGRPKAGWKGAPNDAPAGQQPWFDAGRWPRRLLFGHWAALGLRINERYAALDSGCVWGRSLTALRLEDGALASEPARESHPGG